MHKHSIIVCLAMIAGIPALNGQTLAEIVGDVRDATGAVIVGAKVTATNTATNAARAAETNAVGMYSILGLTPGNYTVRVEREGFRPEAKALEIRVQQVARVDFNLQVGQVDQRVEVTAAAALLDTENATVGTVIEQRRITELPLNGRNFLQLVSLSPNVTYGFTSQTESGARQGGDRTNQNMSVSGARAQWNNYTLDGVLNTDPNFNTYVVLPSVDMLQEFKVQSGIYPAEFGRAATQINVSTKSGTNQYHWSLYEFVRNDKFDARPYDFTVADHARPKNPFQWNQYGFTLGGPVIIPKVVNGRDRLFFMTNFEQFRQVTRANSSYSVPSEAMRRGDFSELAGIALFDPENRVRLPDGTVRALPFEGNRIPENRITEQAKVLLKYIPLPNSPSEAAAGAAPYRNFRQTNRGRFNKDQFHARADFVESTMSNWFGRFSWSDDAQLNPGMYLNGNKNISNARQVMASNVRVFSPTVFNEFRFGWSKLYNLQSGELAYKQDVLSELKIKNLPAPAPQGWAVPGMGVTGMANGYGGGGDPYEGDNMSLQWVDNVTINHGRHSFRFGAEIRRDYFSQFGNQFINPDFQFRGLMTASPITKTGGFGFADLLLGYPATVRYAVNVVNLELRGTSQYYYFDETWRVRPGLTINMGLRYEYNPPFSDANGNFVNVAVPHLAFGVKNVPDMNLHPVMVRSGSGDFYEGLNFRYQPNLPVARDGRLGDRLREPDRNDFAPRIGIAWSPNSRWTVRTGAGIFYSAEVANTLFDLGRSLGGRAEPVGPSDIPTLKLDDFLGSTGLMTTIAASPWTWAMQADIKNTYTLQYLLNIQHELTDRMSLEVGYIGNISRHLWGLYDSNEPVPAGDGSAPRTRAPFPEFGVIQTVHSNARGNYNAGSVKLTRHFSSGLTALIGYTWSKSIDTASAWRGQGDSRSAQTATCYLACERGVSGFNTPHRLVTSVLYELPFGTGRAIGANWGRAADLIVGGWQVSSIITIQSGRPGNINTNFGGRNSLAYTDGERPHATGRKLHLDSSERSLNRWFNTDAVAILKLGEIGNIGRNVLIGPAHQTWDLSLHKNFRIAEGHTLNFRAEAFNFANHPVFARPGLNPLTPSTWGQIRGTDASMRQIQFGLKYIH